MPDLRPTRKEHCQENGRFRRLKDGATPNAQASNISVSVCMLGEFVTVSEGVDSRHKVDEGGLYSKGMWELGMYRPFRLANSTATGMSSGQTRTRRGRRRTPDSSDGDPFDQMAIKEAREGVQFLSQEGVSGVVPAVRRSLNTTLMHDFWGLSQRIWRPRLGSLP